MRDVYLQSQALDRSIYPSMNASCSKKFPLSTHLTLNLLSLEFQGRKREVEKGDGGGGGGGGGGGKGRQLKMEMGRGGGNEYEKMIHEGSGEGREMGKIVTLESWNLVDSGSHTSSELAICCKGRSGLVLRRENGGRGTRCLCVLLIACQSQKNL
jgi:hypothetical protein